MPKQDGCLVVLDPGPIDGSVLTLQSRHRSQDIGQGKTVPRIRLVEHGKAFSQWIVTHASALALLHDAGMYYVSRLSRVVLDHALLRALVERWRPETQTFHFRVGEMTITLRDVALLAALRIDGLPVTCATLRDYKELCIQLLGQAPEHIRAGCVKLKWLRDTFMQELEADASREVVEHYTRAYILYLFGSILFPDPSGNKVNLKWLLFLENITKCDQFAWGAAVLAHIYRELGKVSLVGHTDCCCFLALVQLWAWEYLPLTRPCILAHQDHNHESGVHGTARQLRDAEQHAVNHTPYDEGGEQIQFSGVPKDSPAGCRWISLLESTSKWRTSNLEVYRNQFDLMKTSQVVWDPYSSATVEQLPEVCRDHREVWMSRVPLICIETVQMHVPDRVMRQFGLLQHIPESVEMIAAVTRQGKVAEDWQTHHHSHITLWQERQQRIVSEHASVGSNPEQALKSYMKWYWGITRRWIITPSQQPDSLMYQERAPTELDLTNAIEYIHGVATDAMASETMTERVRHALDMIVARCLDVMCDQSVASKNESLVAPVPVPAAQAPTASSDKTVAIRLCKRQRQSSADDHADDLMVQEDQPSTSVLPLVNKEPAHHCCDTTIVQYMIEHPSLLSNAAEPTTTKSDDKQQPDSDHCG